MSYPECKHSFYLSAQITVLHKGMHSTLYTILKHLILGVLDLKPGEIYTDKNALIPNIAYTLKFS